jgi:hypothetical protein
MLSRLDQKRKQGILVEIREDNDAGPFVYERRAQAIISFSPSLAMKQGKAIVG